MVAILKRALSGILSEEEIRSLRSGIDVVGGIAVLKIPDDLLEKKQVVADALLKCNPSMKTVLRQTLPTAGEYRIRGLEYLAGEDRTVALHREYGCAFEVDLARVYFSPRLSTERMRVAKQVSPHEVVVNMFAGVGSFSIIIAKQVPTARVYSIELNPDAHDLAKKNILLNKVQDRVFAVHGDAKKVIEEEFVGRADRVLMPLPEKAKELIGVAVSAMKTQGGVLHYYTHVHAAKGEEPRALAPKEIESRIAKPYEVLGSRIVREVGPRWFQVAVDIRVRGAEVQGSMMNYG